MNTNISFMRDELTQVRNKIDELKDHINMMMCLSNECLDLRDAKDKLSEVEKELVDKYNDYATRN